MTKLDIQVQGENEMMQASGINAPMLMTSQPDDVVGWGHLDGHTRR
jgi:hypothetical protein